MLYRLKEWYLSGGESEGIIGVVVWCVLMALFFIIVFGIGGNLDRGIW